jgi:phage terminase large subunit
MTEASIESDGIDVIPAAELEKLKLEQGEDFYQQEYENSFEAAIQGAFYANEMRIMLNEGRVCALEIENGVRVHTAWDLGVSDSTAIWFIQCVGRERRLVDYYEASGVGLNHYADVLADKRRQYGWTYGDHFFPHDIKVREFTSGESRLVTLGKLGIEAVVVPQYEELEGINVVRRMLGRTWIDPVRCERGLEALRGYRREYDERLRDWKKSPLHSWESHGADALRYFATGFDDTPSTRAPRIEMLPFVAPNSPAIGYVREADTFATRLERAIERANGARLIEARAVEVPPSEEEV